MFPKYLLLIGMLSLISWAAKAQTIQYKDVVSTHVELEKDTVLLGEPFFLYFVMTNHATEPVYVEEGGDYRSGRQETFTIRIVTKDGDTLPIRDWPSFIGGGRSSFYTILPNESRKFKLLVQLWGKFQEPGTHTLFVSKDFRLTPHNVYAEGFPDYSTVQRLPQTSAKKVVVVEDSLQLGLYIAQLVSAIKTATNGRIASSNGFRLDNRTYRDLSPELWNNLRFLDEIDDDRIVPFLDEALRTGKYITPESIVHLLSKFPDNALALESLLFAAQGPVNSMCRVTEDSIHMTRTSGDIRQTALSGIMKHHHKSAVDFLIQKKNDAYPEERYEIQLRAQYLMAAPDALAVFKAYSTDDHKVIREKAKEELAKMVRRE